MEMISVLCAVIGNQGRLARQLLENMLRKNTTIAERISMSNPNWFSWLSFPFFAPLSGSVVQDIAPNFHRQVDNDVSAEIGLAEQLVILSNAVKELRAMLVGIEETRPGAKLKIASENVTTAMGQLAGMEAKVNEITQRHSQAADLEAERALDRLKEVNPEGYETFIRKRENRASTGGDAGKSNGGSAQ
ncbi:hypothetical protein J4G48_0048730 (plasmid) [Bradyrhizobium barranii subsp. apii]|uniref:hypothetical protein n=1 Tax=Bradyrhizobium barranii TaxID=2992140 RepID=UPI001AA16244|nr:hypothetical protein [Bradyrhizobium barranii]UPU01532.1 hypothetical protein J4G48_0048730 [Bradyrhizobium barranii subsp. apii]